MTTERRIGLPGAVGIGLGAMLGAGVFAVWSPALELAGASLLWAVALAGLVALLNALSTAALAAGHPVAGGAYTFGRREIGPWAGFVAGSGFVVGKTASVAAIALTIGEVLQLEAAPITRELFAVLVIAAAWALNARGVTRTAGVATVIALGVLVAVMAESIGVFSTPAAPTTGTGGGLAGVAGAAGLLFFAFAGYARVATLGEEVRHPDRTIPRAVLASLAVVVTVYLVVGASVLRASGGDPAALGAVLGVWRPVVAIAAFGSMVALTAGVGRTAMAMAREGDLPAGMARQNARGVPSLAEGASAVAACALVFVGDLTLAIAASSVAVLTYYLVANLAAVRLARRARGADARPGLALPWPLSALGAIACASLVVTLPWIAIVVAGAVMAAMVAVRALAQRGRSEK